MALFSFVAAILEGRPIDVYGQGKMSRDFTYVDDIVEALVRLIDIVPAVGERSDQEDSLSPAAPWRAVNIGNGAPVKLMDFIAAIEKHVGRKATINLKPMQMGDVTDTNADTDLLKHLTGFRPSTSIDDGVKAFVDWYRSYYRK
jgi:UDP-glucuronate 4-epimerase